MFIRKLYNWKFWSETGEMVRNGWRPNRGARIFAEDRFLNDFALYLSKILGETFIFHLI